MKLNRRSALGVMGAIGATAVAAREAFGQDEMPLMPPPGSPVIMPAPGCAVRGRMTGAQAVVAALCAHGTPCVFGVPGAQCNELWDAMKSGSVPYLLVTNEASASVMADASARVTGAVGVFAVVPGPGLTNAMTGIGEALYDGVPVVGIVTDIDRRPGAPVGQVHGLANGALLRPICKAVYELQHPGQIVSAIHQAFNLARCGEPGPVAVVIPYWLYTETWCYDEPVPAPYGAVFDEAAYRRALCVLSDRSKRVGIYAGQGCQDATPSLQAVAELLQAPVATSVSGKGVLPDNHPLAVGWGYGKQGTKAAELTFTRDVDLVLAIGVRYSENSTANYALPKHQDIIHVDINPNNLGKNYEAQVAVQADSGQFLNRLLYDCAAVRRPPCPALWRDIAQRRSADRASYNKVEITAGVDPMVFLTHLRAALGAEELVFVDVTASCHWAAEAYEVTGPRRFFTPANEQSMGWSVPAAIGAQRVRPERRVAAVVGDGCFLMSGLEVSTAAREGLPVKFFVLDDGTYHYMQMLQEPTFRRTTATDLVRLDFAALAQGLRVGYNCIPNNMDISNGIARAFAIPGPVLTRVCVSYEGRSIRWLEALKRSYIRKLDTRQKVQMASRVVSRSIHRDQVND